ncbi:hypothetical protein A5742_01585 [Mycolicibacterium fortuitum]|uniref:Uncharacterized protein n=2 Tax=Mycolicibacterium fortuitum TaxID=1766 RepID=A0ABD6QR56_MYCFO|nr:hypothetical protein A5742_01585 [Mycolicibacterium fortuitum]
MTREPIWWDARLIVMRALSVIDAELRALAAYRAACAAAGDPVRSSAVVDRLLDERLELDHFGRPGEGSALG